LPNVGPYIYDVSISGFTRSSIYIYDISSLRVNMGYVVHSMERVKMMPLYCLKTSRTNTPMT